MSIVTEYEPGTFCWLDLMTNDAAGAKKFYTSLFNWTTEAVPIGPDMEYVICRLNEHVVCGYCQPTAEQCGDLPPHWKSYVAVKSVDETLKRAQGLGATVALEAVDVFDVGRMAVIIDPTGAAVALWEGRHRKGSDIVNETGSVVWNELMTPDTKVSGDFYTALFDWTTETHDMGNMIYTMFKSGDTACGGMLAITPEMGTVPPNWMIYFAVDDADATVASATALGGRIIVPPKEIPQVGRFAVLTDPQGAAFAIIKTVPM